MKQQELEGPLDVEGYPVAPEGLGLEQVHIYVRHGALSRSGCHVRVLLLIACTYIGERTPVRVRMSDPPASIPADWQLCNTSKSFYDTMAGYSSTEDGLWYKKVVENRHGKISEGLW
jgi:acid phosphatase